ncbi:MAG: type II toxin-antitoxin system Phd/YefM family antitoxin [Lachnospiraceae bacterium]
MLQIIPIKDLKNTTEISDLCHKSEEPIYITKNGYGDMVIMSIDIYEKTMRQINIYRELEISEKQIKEEKVKNAKSSLISMRTKYGI